MANSEHRPPRQFSSQSLTMDKVSVSSGYSSARSQESFTPSPPRRSFQIDERDEPHRPASKVFRSKSVAERKKPRSPNMSVTSPGAEKTGKNIFRRIGAASQAFEGVGHELGAWIPEVADEVRRSLIFLNELTCSTLRLTQPNEEQSIPQAMDRFEQFLDRTERSTDTFAHALSHIAAEFRPFILLFIRTTAMLSLIAGSFITIGILFLIRQYLYHVFAGSLERLVLIPFVLDLFGLCLLVFCAAVAFKAYYNLLCGSE